jgi:hypothetical protein
MSHDAANSTSSAEPQPGPVQPLPLSPAILIGITGLFLFLASQILALGVAAVWAISGYYHLRLAGLIAVGGVIVTPALYACWKILVLAIAAERDPANN